MFKVIIFTFAAYISLSSEAKIRENFLLTPPKEKVKSSAANAFKTYHFQIPFYTGLAAFLFFDGEISDQASKHTPIFGSQENAKRWSDGLLLSLIPILGYTASQVELFDTNTKDQTFSKRTKLLLFQSSIIIIDFLAISSIKMSSNRVRPDESDSLSFPSGHSSLSSGLSRTIFNNVNNSPLAETKLGKTIQYTSFGISSAIAWARVEGKKHYLSDILLGNAFGAFISDFLYATYLEDVETAMTPSVFFMPGKSTSINISMYF